MNRIRIFILILILMAASLSAAAASLDGAWTGTLAVGQQELPLVLRFSAYGPVRICQMQSPMQSAGSFPLTIQHLSADSVAVSSDALGLAFRAHIADGEITGTLSQAGYDFPLTLTPVLSLEERRPQTPRPPFPYTAIDTTFLAPDGARLACTVTLPQGASESTPIAVMVTGSGQQNRDEELFDHRPFAVIADALARRGVATLRYDDRGAGASEGDFHKATIRDFKADASAALAFARGFVPAGRAGVIGHSEGGTIAMMMAADAEPDFIVSLAGMAVSGKETVLEQNRRLLRQMGYDSAQVAASLAVISAAFDQVIDQTRRGVIEPLDASTIAKSLGVEPPAAILQIVERNMSARNEAFGQFIALDPRPLLPRVSCPVLAINGTLDTQVDCEPNLSAIREGVPSAIIMPIAGLNHMLQHATSGSVDEYIQIRETIAPEVLTAIADFILGL